MQKDSKLLDDLARMAAGAAGGLVEMKREIEAMVSAQMEKLLARMRLVTREEFDAVEAMAAKARAEQERLRADLEQLRTRLDALEGSRAGNLREKASE